jgi:internalin A
LKELEALAELNLTGCTGLIDLSVLSSFKSFFRLNLSGCTGLESISFNNLERVAVLTMDGCRGVISEFPKEVAQLNLRKCRISNSNLSKFIGQRACGHERRLNCLSIIGALPKGLLLLDLSGSRGFKRLPEMAEIGALEAVYLKDCKELKVLPDLSGCNLLSVLDLRGTGVVVGIDEDVVEVAANEENRNTEAVKLLLAAIRERDELAEHARDRDGAPPSAGAVGDFDDGEPAIKKQRRE